MSLKIRSTSEMSRHLNLHIHSSYCISVLIHKIGAQSEVHVNESLLPE